MVRGSWGAVQSLRALGWPVVVVSFFALAIGGGGSQYGLLNLLVQLLAVGLVLFSLRSPVEEMFRLPRALALLLIATAALPIFQLIPVPPGVWHSLPSGLLTYEARELVGAEMDWFPVSVFPLRTAAAEPRRRSIRSESTNRLLRPTPRAVRGTRVRPRPVR